MLSMLGFKSTETGRVSEEELRLIVTGAKMSGGIESQEGMMIEGVLDLQVGHGPTTYIGGLCCISWKLTFHCYAKYSVECFSPNALLAGALLTLFWWLLSCSP